MYHLRAPSVDENPANPAVPTPIIVSPNRINGGTQQDDAANAERIETFLASTLFYSVVGVIVVGVIY